MKMTKEQTLRVCTIIPPGSFRDRLTQSVSKNDFFLSHQPDYDRARAILTREGYRYRLVLAHYSAIKDIQNWLTDLSERVPWVVFALFEDSAELQNLDSSQKDPTHVFESVLLEFKAQAVGKILEDSLEPQSVVEGVIELLGQAKSKVQELPLPPYQSGDTRFLKEEGPLLFSLSHTKRPWALEGDVIMFPVGQAGTFGPLGRAWKKELGGIHGQNFQKLVKDRVLNSRLSPQEPLAENFELLNGVETHHHRLILATSETHPAGTSANPIEVSLAAIDLATRMKGSRTLVVPVVADSAFGLSTEKILRGIMDGVVPEADLGELKHVIFTVAEREVMKNISQIQESGTARGQRLENDLPSGPDHLDIEIETKALADSLAMKEMEPPLVLGIFGGSGTGKSSFIQLLQERFRQLRCWDLYDEDVALRFPYVGHPYLVHFDGWANAQGDVGSRLMQRIFLDVDRQLSLERIVEKAQPGLLRQGVDIWSLLEDLSKEQIEDLQLPLGKKVIKAVNGWKKSGEKADGLWKVLQGYREKELQELEEARQSLSEEHTTYKLKITEKERQCEEEVARKRHMLELSLAKSTKDMEAEIETAQIILDNAKRKAFSETDREIQTLARNEAWGPVMTELKKVLGTAADQALFGLGTKEREAPLSISRLGGQLSFVTKYLCGLLILKAGHGFLALAIFSPIVALVVSLFDVSSFWPTLIAAGGIFGGLLGSAQASLKAMADWIKEQETVYRGRIESAKKKNESRREALLQNKLSADAKPTELRIQQLQARIKTQAENTEMEMRLTSNALLVERLREIEEFKKEGQVRLQELEAQVEVLQSHAGITGRHKTLRDYVQGINAKGDDGHGNNQLDHLQEDVKELTDALLPMDEGQGEIFPRGQPRIILTVDNLDRCKPDQVAKILKAVQLLARTKLFVVVLAMDLRYVGRALEKEYEGLLLKNSHPSGLDWIKKIVQVPYRVPCIAPSAMESYLQSQMEVDRDVTTESVVPTLFEESPKEDDINVMAEPSKPGKPVFESSMENRTLPSLESLPSQVLLCSEEELTLLTECSQAVSLTPRAVRRMVNVFKIFKLIWYYRGQRQGPIHEVKRILICMLARSSSHPVFMHSVLNYLEEECRDGNMAQQLREALMTWLERKESKGVRPETRRLIKEFVAHLTKMGGDVSLATIGSDNIRLIQSFSFSPNSHY